MHCFLLGFFAVFSVHAASIANLNNVNSDGLNADVQLDVSKVGSDKKLFNIMTYHEGVPYLHMRPLLVTSDNQLVVNTDHYDHVFTGLLSEDQTIVSLNNQSSADGLVAVSSDEKLKVDRSPISLDTEDDADQDNDDADDADDDSVDLQNGSTAGPWSSNDGKQSTSSKVKVQFLSLQNSSNAWSCPYDRSGIYRIYWSSSPDTRPLRVYGCIKVGLVIPEQPLLTRN